MGKLHLRFQLSDDPPSHDILATLYREDKVIGHIRMDWSNLPFPRDCLIPTYIKLLDILVELGRQVQEEKWTT